MFVRNHTLTIAKKWMRNLSAVLLASALATCGPRYVNTTQFRAASEEGLVVVGLRWENPPAPGFGVFNLQFSRYDEYKNTFGAEYLDVTFNDAKSEDFVYFTRSLKPGMYGVDVGIERAGGTGFSFFCPPPTFQVGAGEIVYVGNFEANRSPSETNWAVSRHFYDEAEAREALAAYPGIEGDMKTQLLSYNLPDTFEYKMIGLLPGAAARSRLPCSGSNAIFKPNADP